MDSHAYRTFHAHPDQVGTTAPPALRGLDCAPDNPEMFVAGANGDAVRGLTA